MSGDTDRDNVDERLHQALMKAFEPLNDVMSKGGDRVFGDGCDALLPALPVRTLWDFERLDRRRHDERASRARRRDCHLYRNQAGAAHQGFHGDVMNDALSPREGTDPADRPYLAVAQARHDAAVAEVQEARAAGKFTLLNQSVLDECMKVEGRKVWAAKGSNDKVVFRSGHLHYIGVVVSLTASHVAENVGAYIHLLERRIDDLAKQVADLRKV